MSSEDFSAASALAPPPPPNSAGLFGGLGGVHRHPQHQERAPVALKVEIFFNEFFEFLKCQPNSSRSLAKLQWLSLLEPLRLALSALPVPERQPVVRADAGVHREPGTEEGTDRAVLRWHWGLCDIWRRCRGRVRIIRRAETDCGHWDEGCIEAHSSHELHSKVRQAFSQMRVIQTYHLRKIRFQGEVFPTPLAPWR